MKASSTPSLASAASRTARSSTIAVQVSVPMPGENTGVHSSTLSSVIWLTFSVMPKAHAMPSRVLPAPRRAERVNRYMLQPLPRCATPLTTACDAACGATAVAGAPYSLPPSVLPDRPAVERGIADIPREGALRGRHKVLQGEQHREGLVDADGEPHVGPAGHTGGRDADHLSGGVDQRPAGLPLVHRHVGLDQVGVVPARPGRDGAVEGG